MKKLFKKYFFLIVLLISIINVNIPMPISDNGVLQVAIIEIFLPITILIFSILIFIKKLVLKEGYEKILKSIIIFIAFYIILSILRMLLGYEFKQSLLAIKVTIFPMILLFLAKYLKIDKEYMIKNLITFEFIINCIQLTNYTNFRMSNFLGNIMVYLSILVMLFIINVHVLKENKYSLIMKLFSFVNILLTLITPLMAGARSSFYIVCILSILVVVYCIINKKLYCSLIIILLIIASFGINVYCFKNCRNHIGMYQDRILPTVFKKNSVIIEKPNIEIIPPNNVIPNGTESNIPEKNDTILNNNTNIEKVKSDNIRKYLVNKSIESIKKSPLIGEGIMYFDVNTDYGVSLQSAHNFILEYINAYGIIGFIIYLFIHFRIILNIFIHLKDRNLFALIILTIPVILIQSLVQPTMLIVPIVIIYYTLYALYLGWSDIYE